MNRYEQTVGYRFQQWMLNVEEKLTAEERARAYDTFAEEFDSIPPRVEPSSGWGATMAGLCRCLARQHRGEPVGEWSFTAGC